MALSASTVWELRVSGGGSADTNGGGYVTGAAGTDYSQQDAPQYGFANLASTNGTNASPVVSSASHNFVAADVGNLIHITAGTNWTAGWYEIKSVSGNNATLDRACATSASVSSGTYAVGGALASPGVIGGQLISGHIVYVKAGTYTVNSNTTNIAGGCVNSSTGSAYVGYSTNRTLLNTDTRPVIAINLTVTAVFAGMLLRNLILDGALQTASRGSSTAVAIGCRFQNWTNNGTAAVAVSCEFTGCTTAAACAGTALFCVASGNSAFSYNNVAVGCIARGNTSHGFGSSAIWSIAYGNTGTTDGFNVNSTAAVFWVNCISESNGRYGFNASNTAQLTHWLINCSHYGNGTAGVSGLPAALTINVLAPSASVFIDGANQDFRLNNTAGAGALLRGAGYAAWPAVSGSMAGYPDLGAAQHQDAAGGISRARTVIG